MVDHEKKVIWSSLNHREASHDSSCFRDTTFYSHLRETKDMLYRFGYFILGDSAYAIESFILPPFDNAGKRSKEDDFNYYHSSARITVECEFGEIDLRWGIFWKRLCCSLEHTVLICKGAMHLHTFWLTIGMKILFHCLTRGKKDTPL